jgi:hypothetical protein
MPEAERDCGPRNQGPDLQNQFTGRQKQIIEILIFK